MTQTQDEKPIESMVLTQLLRMDATIHGIVFGIMTGLGIFVATVWLVLKGGPVVGPNLALLGHFFIGYDVTWLGSLIGFAYGFLTGFLIGYFVATLYNLIVRISERRLHRQQG